jgi:hypothetical protein
MVVGRTGDGWISADAIWVHLGPGRPRGTVSVAASRAGFCNQSAPKAHVTIELGTVALNEQQKPVIGKVLVVRRRVLANCAQWVERLAARPPVAVAVHVSPTFRLVDYGGSDTRDLGAQVGWTFTPSR